jgi:hypothetical protein
LALARFLLVVLAVSAGVIFFAYPPLLEESDGECSALELRVADLASHDSSGLLTVKPLYGSTSSQPGGAVFAKDRYPLLPASVGCAVAFWKTMVDPSVATAAAVQASPAPGQKTPVETNSAGAGFDPVIARDITPNGDPISPATVFTLPMDAVAVRVAYPGGKSGGARFQITQGKAVLSSCSAEWSAPGIAWCKFNVSLRKGMYSISLTANNVLLGQFPFAVIGR